MTKDIFDNPIFIILLFIFTVIINLLFATHFIPILLAGVIFLAFITTLSNRYYYLLGIVVCTFLFIENTQGFKPFSLLLVSLFIYVFFKSTLIALFASSITVKLAYIVTFYIVILLIYSFINGFNISLFMTILLNIILDIVVVGLFL
jgi:hypothetical protein